MAEKSPLRKPQTNATAPEEELPEEWPVTPSGRPWFRVTVGASEKIGLENIGLKFSSIEVGPVFVTAFVPPGATSIFQDEAERAALTAVLNEVAAVLEVDTVAEQREIAIEALKNSQTFQQLTSQ